MHHPEQTFLIEREGVDVSKWVHISKTNNLRFPFEGPGELVDFLVYCQSPDFQARVEVDNQPVINGSFTTLETRSNDLDKISAYQARGLSILAGGPWPFQESIDARLAPDGVQSVTVDLQRVELTFQEGNPHR